MAYLAPFDISGNQTCQLCCEARATVFCSCTSQSALLCSNCIPQHQCKAPTLPHVIIPIAALGMNPEEYVRRGSALNKGKAELRRNVEMMDKCVEELRDSMNAGIEYLAKYRDFLVQRLQAERELVAETVEKVIQEAESCLAQGTLAKTPLAQALCELPAEGFQVFSYTVTPPDLQSCCESWLSCVNTMSQLSDRFAAPSVNLEESKQIQEKDYQKPLRDSSYSLIVSPVSIPANVMLSTGSMVVNRPFFNVTEKFLEISEVMKADFHRKSEEIFEQNRAETAKTIGRHRLPIGVLEGEIRGKDAVMKQFFSVIQPYGAWRRSKRDENSFYRCVGVMLLEDYCRPSTPVQDFEAFYNQLCYQREQFAISSEETHTIQSRKSFITLQKALIRARKRGENAFQQLQYYLQRPDIDNAVVTTVQHCANAYMRLHAQEHAIIATARCFSVILRVISVEKQGVTDKMYGQEGEAGLRCLDMVCRGGVFDCLVRREVHETDGYDFVANAYNPVVGE